MNLSELLATTEGSECKCYMMICVIIIITFKSSKLNTIVLFHSLSVLLLFTQTKAVLAPGKNAQTTEGTIEKQHSIAAVTFINM